MLLSRRIVACARVSMSSQTSIERPVAEALKDVLHRINQAATRVNRADTPRLVAVSKTKPVPALMEAYEAGQRIFGENYVQEMLDKAPQMPKDVQWHFIGHLQSNKVKTIVEGVPNLAMVETIDSIKLADKVNKAIEAAGTPAPLPVMVQVNTSGEKTKYGVEPDQCVELAVHVANKCKSLKLAGLMTIGQPDYSSRPENFQVLAQCRQKVAEALQISSEQLELSMGMSGDYEQAVEMGSTNVRVGSTIFGARQYPTKPASPRAASPSKAQ